MSNENPASYQRFNEPSTSIQPPYNPSASPDEQCSNDMHHVDIELNDTINNHNNSNEVAIDINHNDNSDMANSNAITLSFRTLTGQLLPLVVHDYSDCTVSDIKQLMELQHHIPASYQRYIFSGRELIDNESMISYNIQNNSIIHILLKQNDTPPQSNTNRSSNINDGSVLNNNQQPPPVGAPVAYPVPVPIQANNHLSHASHWYQLTFSYGRLVKIFAIVDMLSMLIYSFYFWPFAIGIPFCLLGYIGVQRINNKLVYSYVIWLIAVIGIFMYYMIQYFSTVAIIFLVITCIIQLYIIYLITRYILYANMLSDAEKQELFYLYHPNRQPVQ